MDDQLLSEWFKQEAVVYGALRWQIPKALELLRNEERDIAWYGNEEHEESLPAFSGGLRKHLCPPGICLFQLG